MLKRHLEAIRKKEKAARAAAREVLARADSIRERYREEGRTHLDEVRADSLELQKSLVAKARVEGEEKIAALRAENAKRTVALSISSKKNFGKAIKIVIKAFKEGV
jgi:nucleosome binding factor SPN SPT16 subunit